jgi:AbrB family looped-hinge helix DNA binding protein
MITKTVKISEKGQIAIPLEIREAANLKQGDELLIVQYKNKLMLEKTGHVAEQIKDDFRDLLKNSEKTAQKMWGSKADDIWDTL